jgi:hypothetical protein
MLFGHHSITRRPGLHAGAYLDDLPGELVTHHHGWYIRVLVLLNFQVTPTNTTGFYLD